MSEEPQRWELRVSRRYGSWHLGYFRSQLECEQRAQEIITKTGNRGRITAVLGNVVYFTEHKDDDE